MQNSPRIMLGYRWTSSHKHPIFAASFGNHVRKLRYEEGSWTGIYCDLLKCPLKQPFSISMKWYHEIALLWVPFCSCALPSSQSFWTGWNKGEFSQARLHWDTTCEGESSVSACSTLATDTALSQDYLPADVQPFMQVVKSAMLCTPGTWVEWISAH